MIAYRVHVYTRASLIHWRNPNRDCLFDIRLLTRDTLNAPWLLTNRPFQWTGNGHSHDRWLNSASRVLISTCSAPLVQTGERKQFSLFDLDFWHTTLTYNPRLAKVKVKVDPHAKNQGQRSNGSNRRVPTGHSKLTHTHTHTHGRYQTYYLPCYAVDYPLKRVTKVFWVSVSGVRVGVLFRVSVSVRDLVRLGLPNNGRLLLLMSRWSRFRTNT